VDATALANATTLLLRAWRLEVNSWSELKPSLLTSDSAAAFGGGGDGVLVLGTGGALFGCKILTDPVFDALELAPPVCELDCVPVKRGTSGSILRLRAESVLFSIFLFFLRVPVTIPFTVKIRAILLQTQLGSPKKKTSLSASSALQEKLQRASLMDKSRPTDNNKFRENGFSITEKTALWYYKRIGL
jgi:hypothetical protein